MAVTGKLDKYTNGPEFTTSAQAEGAIEGTIKDVRIHSTVIDDPIELCT